MQLSILLFVNSEYVVLYMQNQDVVHILIRQSIYYKYISSTSINVIAKLAQYWNLQSMQYEFCIHYALYIYIL